MAGFGNRAAGGRSVALTAFSRRVVLMALGALGLSSRAAAQVTLANQTKRSTSMGKYMSGLPADFNPGPLDLTKPRDNQVALLKLQADFSGEPVIGSALTRKPKA